MADVRHGRWQCAGLAGPLCEAGGAGAEAVVFVHGNPGCGAEWAPLVGAAGDFVRAVAPDMPGFGHADKPAGFDYTVAGYARHLDTLLATLGIARAHLVLHDFGGPWGLAWAAAHPERVASVTLINTGILAGYRWHYLARIWRTPLLGELFQATATLPAFRLLLRHGNPRGLPPGFVERMFETYDAGTRRAVLRLYRATGDVDALANAAQAALRPHDLPALVVWGARDPYLPVRHAGLQRETFPRAEVVLLEDSGHWPFADHPEAVAAAVLPFLRRVAGAGGS
ncbi:MAG: alpha/beta hydrolase [Gammaproteobacteria bacterium]|nr:alpha/beta hydrolase [Gammaproteobacteria bacterium]MBI5618614.1 alpha/beta hydrolase [Gammaproteobacteria bacterium]